MQWYCYLLVHDGRRLGLSNTPAVMEHDNNRTNRGIHSHSSKHTNTQHNPCISNFHIFIYSRIHIFTYVSGQESPLGVHVALHWSIFVRPQRLYPEGQECGISAAGIGLTIGGSWSWSLSLELELSEVKVATACPSRCIGIGRYMYTRKT